MYNYVHIYRNRSRHRYRSCGCTFLTPSLDRATAAATATLLMRQKPTYVSIYRCIIYMCIYRNRARLVGAPS